MAEIIADMVQESSVTSGTGPITLDGAVTGYRTFTAGIGAGNQCRYCINNGIDFEVGLGTVLDELPARLSRDIVETSSNNNDLVNFGTDRKQVMHTISAAMYQSMYTPGIIYGVMWDSVTDSMIKGVVQGGNFIHSTYIDLPIQSQMARVLRDTAGAPYGYSVEVNPTNSALTAAGVAIDAATYTTNNADMQVRIPSHYQLWHRSGNVQYILISEKYFEFDGVAASIPLCFNGDAHLFVDAFHTTIVSDVGRSRPFGVPAGSKTRSEFRTAITARGTGAHMKAWSEHQMLVALIVTEYGSWKSQLMLPGYTEASTLDASFIREVGRTLSLGNSSGSVPVSFSGADSDLIRVIGGGGTEWTSNWVESVTRADETLYYYTGALAPVKPVKVFNTGTEVTGVPTVGDITAFSWAWGNIDSLAADTIYMKFSGNIADPTPDTTLGVGALTAQMAVLEGAFVANSYRGIENIFGSINEFIDGIIVQYDVVDGHTLHVCTDHTLFSEDPATNYTLIGEIGVSEAYGFITDIIGTGVAALYPSHNTNGSSDSYLCDVYLHTVNEPVAAVLVGGSLTAGGGAGITHLNATIDGTTASAASVGARGAISGA